MARTGVTKTTSTLLFLREIEPVRRCISKLVNTDTDKNINRSTKGGNRDILARWVPHPRTGIYYPEGNEHIMNGVPDGAAYLTQTYWLRNVDGVEKPQY